MLKLGCLQSALRKEAKFWWGKRGPDGKRRLLNSTNLAEVVSGTLDAEKQRLSDIKAQVSATASGGAVWSNP